MHDEYGEKNLNLKCVSSDKCAKNMLFQKLIHFILALTFLGEYFHYSDFPFLESVFTVILKLLIPNVIYFMPSKIQTLEDGFVYTLDLTLH